MRVGVTGWVLAVWSFAFACVHMAWALGWRAGVPPEAEPIAERPWFLAYDVAAGVLMYAAAAVAVLLARGGLSDRIRGRLMTATLIGSLLALARGVPALVWDMSAGEFTGVGFGADAWFTVAGLLGLVLWRGVRAVTVGRSRLLLT